MRGAGYLPRPRRGISINEPIDDLVQMPASSGDGSTFRHPPVTRFPSTRFLSRSSRPLPYYAYPAHQPSDNMITADAPESQREWFTRRGSRWGTPAGQEPAFRSLPLADRARLADLAQGS